MIPNIIHFCFGLEENFGGRPFSFIHYLAVKSAYQCNRPRAINFYYKYKPDGEWWEKSQGYLNLIACEPPKEVFGNPLLHYAHRADVLKLEVLLREGGVFLDLDVLCLRPFGKLMRYDVVLGREGKRGLCNAVILAKPAAEFLRRWYAAYRFFRSQGRDEFWGEHSVAVPAQIAADNPGFAHIQGEFSFFWPRGEMVSPLWGKMVSGVFPGLMQSFKTVVSRAVLSRVYCIHLWESQWWEAYLKGLTPEYVRKGKNNFCRLCQRLL